LSSSDVAHPFLITTQADYDELRARASTSPWREMKLDAISTATAGYEPFKIYPDPKNGPYDELIGALHISDVLSASALAFILDVDHETLYKDRIVEGILNELDHLGISGSHRETVLPATALFNAILALDVVRPKLSASEISEIESRLQSKISRIQITGNWPLARYALHGTWNLYRNAGADYKDPYYEQLIRYTTQDGIFRDGTGYAIRRFSDLDRPLKSLFMDVLEFTGRDNRYYSDPRIQDFHRWTYSGTMNPAGKAIPFGDTNPDETGFDGADPIYRAGKFGPDVAGYAAWANDGTPARGRLPAYVIPDAPLPEPVTPSSQIYTDGGAWFWEDSASVDALMGALWNTRFHSNHSHADTNAIYVAGFGEHLLINSGYGGSGRGINPSNPGIAGSEGVDRHDWDWIHNDSSSGNTVLVNDQRHRSKHGAGLVEGFTAGRFDYASGDAGSAIGPASHIRNFVFVHPQDDRDGYFLLFDEVAAESGDQIAMLLHPNTKAQTGITTVSDRLEYRADIDGLVFNDSDVKLTTFYGTAPATVALKNGGVGTSWSWHEINGFTSQYLQSVYHADELGAARFVTVLFPHAPGHPVAGMDRLSGAGHSGASVDLGDDVIDVALESDGLTEQAHAGVTFRGKATVYRKQDDALRFYFVRKGRQFDDGSSLPTGFSAESDVTLYLRGKKGRIILSDCNPLIRFDHPGITGVRINGVPQPITESGDGWVQIQAQGGTGDLELIVSAIDFDPSINVGKTTSPFVTAPDVVVDGCSRGGAMVPAAFWAVLLIKAR